MKTLRSEWTDFFQQHREKLEHHYPGLQLQRFLMEVQDILLLRLQNPRIHLDLPVLTVSSRLQEELTKEFLVGRPLSYLTQFSEFYGRRFYVNDQVLIPRPETEYLVELIIQSGPYQRALDVGVGSGVIILTLLAEGTVHQGVGVDISSQALKVAQTNAFRHDLECELLLSDRLNHVTGDFDLIAANPPYIKSHSHRPMVHHQVDQFEPQLALYLSEEEYDPWFSVFFQQVLNSLRPHGVFFMEGHECELQGQALKLGTLGFRQVEVLKDYSGRDRFLKAHK